MENIINYTNNNASCTYKIKFLPDEINPSPVSYLIREIDDLTGIPSKLPRKDSNSLEIDVSQLASAIRKRPTLWDTTRLDFKNRTLKPGLWIDVAREMNYDESKITEIRRKWEILKSSYIRSKKDNFQKKDYRYSKELNFLDKILNIIGIDDSSSKSENSNNDLLEPIKEKTKISEENQCTSFQSNSMDSPIKPQNDDKIEQENPADLFAKYVGAELKNIPESLQDEVKLRIMNVIMEVKKKIK